MSTPEARQLLYSSDLSCLASLVPGTFIFPIGLFISGWAAQNHVHWVVTDLVRVKNVLSFSHCAHHRNQGIAFIGIGMILNFQVIQVYVIDCFSFYAASALAAVSCLRALAGFGFPLFAPVMYEKLGYGKGDTVLACAAIVLGCPAYVFFQNL